LLLISHGIGWSSKGDEGLELGEGRAGELYRRWKSAGGEVRAQVSGFLRECIAMPRFTPKSAWRSTSEPSSSKMVGEVVSLGTGPRVL